MINLKAQYLKFALNDCAFPFCPQKNNNITEMLFRRKTVNLQKYERHQLTSRSFTTATAKPGGRIASARPSRIVDEKTP